MPDIYRVFEYNKGSLIEIAFVEGKESTTFFLNSCNSHKENPEILYFAEKIKI